MPAIIHPIGHLKTYIGDQAEVSVPSGQDVRSALRMVGIPPELVALVLINEAACDKDTSLQEGDVVKVVAVIGGGKD